MINTFMRRGIEAIGKNVYLKGFFMRGIGSEHLRIAGSILAFHAVGIELLLVQLVDNAVLNSGAASQTAREHTD